MAKGGIQFSLSFANGQTMDKFSDVIASRMKWCNESAKDSIAACAIDALKSIRAKCRVAKPSSIKVKIVVDSTLEASAFTTSGHKNICLRYTGSKQRYFGNEKIYWAERPTGMYKAMKAYRFSHNDKNYIVVASSESLAQTTAKKIVVRKALRYAGLAKRALGFLMKKTATINVKDDFNPVVEIKADDVTDKAEILQKNKDGSQAKYGIILKDTLRYALDAIKGGKSEIDACLKRSMNKIVSVINQKIKRRKDTFFKPQQLETPFPELRKRK